MATGKGRGSGRRGGYTRSTQNSPRLAGRYSADTDSGTGRGAEIIPLNPHMDTTRNTLPPFDGSYVTPPPVTVPYGWRLTETRSGWTLTHDRDEWSVISWLVSERRAGRSCQELVDQLESERVPAPRGGRSKPKWNRERVRTLVYQYAPETAPRKNLSRYAYLLRQDVLSDEEQEELEDLAEAERAAIAADNDR